MSVLPGTEDMGIAATFTKTDVSARSGQYRAGQWNEDRMYIRKGVFIFPKTLIFPREYQRVRSDDHQFSDVHSVLIPLGGTVRRGLLSNYKILVFVKASPVDPSPA